MSTIFLSGLSLVFVGGFGMNGATLVYNTSTNAQHSFQVNDIQKAYINSNGF